MINFNTVLNKTINNLKFRRVYEPKLNLIVYRLENLKILLEDEEPIKQNPIRGITRAYLDIFSDYDNPILKDLYFLEKEVEKKVKG
ncbi:hypothetical protein CAPN006_21510 [Capnocytophaga canimorsus]|uniref:hypothetical protein n=1 Tax=Capnocytophaga canimorsus TaxID=28188 RepID=UPI001ACC3795|nr:hypothetical protein [Capnocytophaga canimorsus]GIM57759.1 hypothetical protein CAPN006_21510 [Capnocytophaga canimorsus]